MECLETNNMYLLTEWEGRTGKYLAQGHIAHFDRKVGIYIATKLFQFAFRKEPYAILAGPDGYFRPRSRHRVWPSYGDFLSSFAMKARAGPYGSYDNYSYSRKCIISKYGIYILLLVFQPQCITWQFICIM